MRAAVIGEDGRVFDRIHERTRNDRDAFTLRIANVVAQLDRSAAGPVGIGLPGRVDVRANLPVSAGYLDIGGLPIPALLGAELGRTVRLDNDAAMALRAEMAIGAARGLRNVVMLTIGTGIGGALALDGRLVLGHGFAGQLGHMTVEASGPELCNCGRRGCVETTSSGSALGRLICAAGLPRDTTASDLLRRAAEGDALSLDIVRSWAGPLRSALESTMAVIDPDLIVLGGGLGTYASSALAFAPPASAWFRRPVVAAALGDDAGVIGAGLCALQAARERLPLAGPA